MSDVQMAGHLPIPSLDELHAEAVRKIESGEMRMEVLPPEPSEVWLARNILSARPDPLSPNPASVAVWFGIQSLLSRQRDGTTAKQLARWLGLGGAAPHLGRVLEYLAAKGELRRVMRGVPRYFTKPPVKLLPHLLRQFPERLPPGPRDGLELAVMAYQEEAGEKHWGELAQALVELVAALPGWPAELPRAIAASPVEWLIAATGVEPPTYVVVEEDPVTTRLREENVRLAGELAASQARVAELEAVAAENEELRSRLDDLESWLTQAGPVCQDAELVAFLDGQGRGALPDMLPASEVERLRELVVRTRAPRPIALALAAGLGTVYKAPTDHQRLTTLSFKEHPFDSLWRMRVASYRIVYGLRGRTPQVVTIASRADVYGETVHALKNRRF